MHADDEDEDRTVIRPPSARTQGPRTGTPASSAGHHATQQHGAAGFDPRTGAPTPPTAAPTQRIDAPAPPPPAASSSSGQHTLTLPQGTRLAEFEITSTIGEGGFGIVYLAWDHSLQRKVALKEYMPSAIASRAGGTEIRPRSERHQETFEAGLKSFINEARLLAQFDHPSLLKVYRFWEANGTAYMVMPFLEGTTLRDAVRALPGPPDEQWILTILSPLFDALTMLHNAQIFHRDIAPDNVLLMADTGRPLLLDFGAARRVIGDMTQALTAILKPGYAPVEQYAEVPGLKQGAWTDVYALAAVVHWMILGKTPSPSVGRMFDDAQVAVAEKAAGRYSEQFLGAIDRALAVLPDKRTPSIEAFRHDLTGGVPVTGMAMPQTTFGATGMTMQGGLPRTVPPTAAQRTLQAMPQSLPHTQAHTQGPDRTRQQTVPPTAGQRTQAHAPAHAPAHGSASGAAPARRKLPLVIGGGLAVVVVAVAGVLFWPKGTTPPATTPAGNAATTTTPTTTPPATTATTPAALPATTPAATTPPVETPAVATTPPPATTAVTTPPPAEPAAATTTTTAPTTATTTPATTPARRTTPRTETPRAETPRSEPVRERPVQADPPVRTETRPAASDNTQECARLFTKISLGEADASVMERVRALRCR